MEHRTEKITFRVTPSELKCIQKKFEGTNHNLSGFVRASVLNKEIIVMEGIEELAKQLRAVGRNLNQLTILAHKGRIKSPKLYEIENKLDEVWKAVSTLAKAAGR